MGERKVQAKYYPPDFDPSQLPRVKKKHENDDAVRFMLPMSVRCETCGEFMGTGLKFNARKSNTGDDYLGIRIFRFSMKCKGCPATFSIRTDPKNSDYSCEAGVRRNYEPWRDAKKAEQEAGDERQRQDQDALQALENKTLDAKQQMEDLDALDDIKTINAKRARVDIDDMLESFKNRAVQLSEADEARIERDVKSVTVKKSDIIPPPPSQIAFQFPHSLPLQSNTKPRNIHSKSPFILSSATLKVQKKIKKKPVENNTAKACTAMAAFTPTSNSLVAYGSSDSCSEDE